MRKESECTDRLRDKKCDEGTGCSTNLASFFEFGPTILFCIFVGYKKC